jgi:hypothetical protein
MSTCSHTNNCALFPMISVNSALKVWRTFYCEGKWQDCARFKLSLEGKPVPPNLLPNGKILDMEVGDSNETKQPAPTTKNLDSSFAEELNDIESDIASIATPKAAPPPAPAASSPTPPVSAAAPVTRPAADGPTASYYLRMQIAPATGVMSEIIRTLGEKRIRIDAVTEKKGSTPDAPSYLIVLTDQSVKSMLDEAVDTLSQLTSVTGDVKVIELEAMQDGQLT